VAGPNELLDKGFVVTTPVPRFHVVELTDVEEVGLLDSAGGEPVGICQEGVDALDVERRRVVRVRPMGISRAVAGASFPLKTGGELTLLASDVEGRVVVASDGDNVVGKALTPSGAVGDWVNVLLTPGLKLPEAGQ
jgi:hypothetical protein